MADYNIILADEHELFLEGIQNLLENDDEHSYEISAKARSGKELISIVENNIFDALIFEVNFVDIEPEDLITQIKRLNKDIKLFVLSAYGDMKLVKTCFRLGVDGYLLKSSGFETLKNGLNDIFRDNIYIGENLKVAPEINHDSSNNNSIQKKKMIPIDRFQIRAKLTQREKEILHYIYQEKRNKRIACELYKSEHTVGVHRKHIMKKIGVTTTNHLINFVKEFEILINQKEITKSY
jgi:DNA-binding NarL/FixJ family response regulator